MLSPGKKKPAEAISHAGCKFFDRLLLQPGARGRNRTERYHQEVTMDSSDLSASNN